MTGILPIDKPQGFTSFDVIAKLRGILKERRLGHSGTLDPMATGVLPVFIGRATRAIDLLSDNEKRYSARFRLGVLTDTQDSSGEVLRRTDVKVTRSGLENELLSFSGRIMQLPPMYSAVRVGGKRLYDLAREGKEVERQPREVKIFSLALTDFDEDTQTGGLEIACSKGTYIRTLINDLAESAGTLGVMTDLRRTYSQGFEIGGCFTLPEVEDAAKSGDLDKLILPLERCFDDLPRVDLTPKLERLYRNGVKLEAERVGAPIGRVRVYGAGFLGVAETKDGIFRAVKNFFGDSNE